MRDMQPDGRHGITRARRGAAMAAIAAKKHVFAEKPVCVDVGGYHACIAAHEQAAKQGTAIVTGTQYRRQTSFIEGMKRINDGMIGEVVGMTARYCSNGIWYRERKPGTIGIAIPGCEMRCVDLDGNTLRVCQATQRSGGPVVTKLASASLELSPDANRTDPAIVGPAIARALAKLRIKPATLVMGIPRAQVVLRSLLLPSVQNAGELASLVHLQAGRDLPFRPEDAIVDFQVRRTINVPQRATQAPETTPGLPASANPPNPTHLKARRATTVTRSTKSIF